MTWSYAASTGGFYNSDFNTDIPSDAVDLTDDEYTALQDAQAEGQEIVADDSGSPLAQDRTYTDTELLAQIRKKRDKLLLSSDYTQLLNTALEADEVAEWATYRQTLRDLPATYADDPSSVVWPDAPE